MQFSKVQRSKHRILPLLLVSFFGILLALGVTEIILSRARLPVFRYLMSGLVYDLDREVLFKITPNCRPDINSSGYRDREFTTKTSDKKRILMLGDSFLIGLNSPSASTIPKLLEKGLGNPYEVLNMGIYGYGPDQSYLRFLQEGFQLHPDMVLLQMFPANDFNDLEKNDLLYQDSDGILHQNPQNLVARTLPSCNLCVVLRMAATGHYFDPAGEKDLTVRLFRDTYDYDLLRDPHSAVSLKKKVLMRAILKELKNKIASLKTSFGIVLIPAMENIQNPTAFREQNIPFDRQFIAETEAMEICHSEKIPYLNLTEPFLALKNGELYEPKEGHLSVTGNRHAAALIQNFVLTLE